MTPTWPRRMRTKGKERRRGTKWRTRWRTCDDVSGFTIWPPHFIPVFLWTLLSYHHKESMWVTITNLQLCSCNRRVSSWLCKVFCLTFTPFNYHHISGAKNASISIFDPFHLDIKKKSDDNTFHLCTYILDTWWWSNSMKSLKDKIIHISSASLDCRHNKQPCDVSTNIFVYLARKNSICFCWEKVECP